MANWQDVQKAYEIVKDSIRSNPSKPVDTVLRDHNITGEVANLIKWCFV